MHTQSHSHASNTLSIMLNYVRFMSTEGLVAQDVTLLEQIAHHCSAIAQEVRVQEQAQVALIETFEEQERYGFDAHAACGH
jgi:N12 class adenine-specific DNA methylase